MSKQLIGHLQDEAFIVLFRRIEDKRLQPEEALKLLSEPIATLFQNRDTSAKTSSPVARSNLLLESIDAFEDQKSKLLSLAAAERLRPLQIESHTQGLYAINNWKFCLKQVNEDQAVAQASGTVQISSLNGELESQAWKETANQNQETLLMMTSDETTVQTAQNNVPTAMEQLKVEFG